MSLRLRLILLPHEWYFGAFLLIQWLRLVEARGALDPHALLYAGLLLASSLVITRCFRKQTNLRWQVRPRCYNTLTTR